MFQVVHMLRRVTLKSGNTCSQESENKMPDLETAADSYFSLWLNRPHCELANDIGEIPCVGLRVWVRV